MASGYKSIEISSCRSCKSKELKLILDLGLFYLSEFSDSSKKPKNRFPLTLIICEKCSLVQLKHTTPPSKLYTENYGYKSGINNTMRKELGSIVGSAMKYAPLKKGDLVMDIGANDGTLLSFYPKEIIKIAVEPVKKLARETQKYSDIVINDYFKKSTVGKTVKNKKVKIITAIAMFYDLPDPNKFLTTVEEILDNDGIFIIQQNYLCEMMRLNAFDNIVHEHLEYYSLTSLEPLLERHGLKVFDVETLGINGGSFRTYISKSSSSRLPTRKVIDMRLKEKKLKLSEHKTYLDFSKRVTKNRKRLRDYIEKESKMGRTTYIYGASTRGNTTIQYLGLDRKLIPFAVERNPEKWGKFIASAGIPIISEEKARSEMPSNMLVLPWFFKEEFLKRERDYLKKGGKFIFPFPNFEIVKA